MCEFDTREYKFALFNCISLLKTIIRPIFTQRYGEYTYIHVLERTPFHLRSRLDSNV